MSESALLKIVVTEVLALQQSPESIIYQQLGAWLVGALLANERYDAEVVDVGYDCSSHAVRLAEGYRLDDYATVADFLDNAYTGNTLATYCSGSGLAAESYREAAWSFAHDALYAWLNERLPGLYDEGLDAGLGFDTDDLCEALCGIGDEIAFVEAFSKRPLSAVWDAFLPTALEARHQARIRLQLKVEQQRQHQERLATEGGPLLQQLNTRWAGCRFEKANVEELWTFLDGLERSGLGNQVAAALRLQSRSFQMSNKVTAETLARYPWHG